MKKLIHFVCFNIQMIVVFFWVTVSRTAYTFSEIGDSDWSIMLILTDNCIHYKRDSNY